MSGITRLRPLVSAEPLSAAEQERLGDLETVVERGFAAFVEVGRALVAIRDERLYRATHPSFAAYLGERWAISRSRAYRLIAAAEVAVVVSPVGDIPNERQARELVPILRDAGVQELQDVVVELRAEHGELVTADVVRRAVRQRLTRAWNEQARTEQRDAAETAARAEIARVGNQPVLEVADVRYWRPPGVSVVITDPPYADTAAYAALAAFAVEVLPEGGALVAVASSARLNEVLAAMTLPGLSYRDTLAWLFEGGPRGRDFRRCTFTGWKPVLVFHKGVWEPDVGWVNTRIVSPTPAPRELHEHEQPLGPFERLVLDFTLAGDTVCDPFLGSGTTAVAALKHRRRFVGADVNADAVTKARARLDQQESA
jgi:hypothetical protein